MKIGRIKGEINWTMVIATFIAGAVCVAWMWFTKGVSGIGWFVLALLIIDNWKT
jgi:hypothetical protein